MLPLVYAGVPENEREVRAADALKASGLDETYFGHKSNQISGGQVQRVAIARALVNDPTLILADEPTGDLDPMTAYEIAELMAGLNRMGTTLIVATHAIDIVTALDRRVIAIDGGRIVRDGRLPR